MEARTTIIVEGIDIKVLVISHMFPSIANEIAGIFVYEQVRSLMTKGIEVRIVSPVPSTPFPINCMNPKWRTYRKIPKSSTWNGVQTYYPRYVVYPRSMFFATSGCRMYYGIRKTVNKLHKEFPFDLIHAHVALPDGYSGALLSRDYEKPLVVTIHGQDLQYTVHRDAKCKEAIAYVLHKSSKIIVVSEKLRRLALEHYNVGDKLHVVPNGVDIQKIALAKKEKDNTRGRKEIILSVSNLVPSKGIDLNIHAIKRLKDKYPRLQYWVVGSGPEEKKLRNLVAYYGLEERVKFLGRQPHTVTLGFMAGCDLFSLPSWNEGFGIAYIEAMAMGKPVIGCKGEGPDDFLEHGKNGLAVRPRDVDDLVEAIDFLLSHPEEARAMGERARTLVLEHYTWEKNAEKNIQVYREVLNEN